MAKVIVCQVDHQICNLDTVAKGCRRIPDGVWKGKCTKRLQVKLSGRELDELREKSKEVKNHGKLDISD